MMEYRQKLVMVVLYYIKIIFILKKLELHCLINKVFLVVYTPKYIFFYC